MGDKSKDKKKVEQAGYGCNWIYLRDGTSLTELLREELGVDLEVEYESESESGKENRRSDGGEG